MSQLHVLLIDPDPDSAAETCQLIHDSGMQVSVATAADLPGALSVVRAAAPLHVVLLEQGGALSSADALWAAFRAHPEPLSVVVLSQRGDDEAVLDAQRRGAAQFVQKPLDLASLVNIFSANGMYSFSVSRHP